MKERPILFSDPMVRAILDGRKTQTRRVVKRAALQWLEEGFKPDFVALQDNAMCPYGQPGDRLWVRETHFIDDYDQVDYRASPPEGCHWDTCCRWTPSIHMPRWASRITLEIVSVRVERLNEISEADALEEGITYNDIPNNGLDPTRARTWFRGLWESINGAGSWGANPWVWVIEFKRAD